MDNQEIHEELYGYDYEVFRYDFSGESKTETILKTCENGIEEAFDVILMASTKLVNKLKKANSVEKVKYVSTEYGCEIYLDNVKIHEFYIKELEKAKVE